MMTGRSGPGTSSWTTCVPDPFPLIEREPVDVTGLASEMWQLLGRIDDRFPGGWVLVGGQMVLLLGLEHEQLPRRETIDADALINVKVMPDGTARVARFLQAEGLELAGIAVDGQGHRFVGRGLAVDVLAPDNIGTRAALTTVAPARTVKVPAGTRLLRSPRRCPVRAGDAVIAVPRPDLDAAIVGKAAAMSLPHPTRHGEDLAFLCGLVVDPRVIEARLTRSDRRWLTGARGLLDDRRVWRHAADPSAARSTLRFLLAESSHSGEAR